MQICDTPQRELQATISKSGRRFHLVVDDFKKKNAEKKLKTAEIEKFQKLKKKLVLLLRKK
jgi:hypothetical protein